MAQAHVQWRLLGGPEITVNGEAVDVRFDRSRAVMTYLVLHAEDRVRTDRLIDELWQDQPPKSARNSVQRFIADLRHDLGSASDRIESVSGGYLLRLHPGDDIDVDRVTDDIRRAHKSLRAGRPGDALDHLSGDLDLTHEPFHGLDHTTFAITETTRLRTLVLDARELRVRCHLAAGNDVLAAADARAVLDEHPSREQSAADLMLALYRTGQATEALAVSRQLHRTMAEQFGCVPMPGVRDLERKILDHDPSLNVTRQQPQTRLPEHGLLGRDALLNDLDALLDAEMLVTLTGPGGIGKTTLASVAARRWAERTGGSVYEVPLASVTAAGFDSIVGEAVGVSSRPDEDRSLEIIDRLQGPPTLLVLDNCEHLIDVVRTFVATVRRHAPTVRVLCTSRVSIGDRAEVLTRVDVLDPASAKQLLLNRADRLGAPIEARDDQLDRLLGRLDGIPLALELAASAMRTLGVADLLERSRIPMARPRSNQTESAHEHRTMDSALEWSISLLDERDVDVLTTCARFATDFDLGALIAATRLERDDLVDRLATLIDHSLVIATRRNGRGRYRLLVPIREGLRNRERNSARAVEQRLVRHYVDVAEQAVADMCGADPSTGLDSLTSDVANFRLAFEWADRDDDVQAMTRLATAVGYATGLSPATLAHGALQDWTQRIEQRLTGHFDTDQALYASLAWAHAGYGNWTWLRRLPDNDAWTDISAVSVAVAIMNSGDSTRAWKWFRQADLDLVDNPAMTAWAGALGSMLAMHALDATAFERLNALAITASERARSVMATYWTEYVRASNAFIAADYDEFETISSRQLLGVSGHGLITLEHHSKQTHAAVAFALHRQDPVPVLTSMLGEVVQQHSPNPEVESVMLGTVVLILDSVGNDVEAARLAGLLRRLGVSVSVYDTQVSEFHRRVDADPSLRAARSAGQTSGTIEVLQLTHAALRDISVSE